MTRPILLRPVLAAATSMALLAAPVAADTIVTYEAAPMAAAPATAPVEPAADPGFFTRILIAIGLAPATSLRPVERPAAIAALPAPAPLGANVATIVQNGQRHTVLSHGSGLVAPSGDRDAMIRAIPLPSEVFARLR